MLVTPVNPNKPLYLVFIDVTRAFSLVKRAGLFVMLNKIVFSAWFMRAWTHPTLEAVNGGISSSVGEHHKYLTFAEETHLCALG